MVHIAPFSRMHDEVCVSLLSLIAAGRAPTPEGCMDVLFRSAFGAVRFQDSWFLMSYCCASGT